MKQLRLFIFSAVTFSLLFSCNRHHPYSEDIKIGAAGLTSDSATTAMETAASTKFIPPNLNERDFVRTASLQFKANNVVAAIIESENKVRALGGYVSLSRMNNSLQDSNCVQKTEDSLVRTVSYLTQAELVLRLPDNKLDSLLTSLANISTMMYHREINCDDVSIERLDNKLKSGRAEAASQRLKTDIDYRGKKLSDISEVEKTIEERDAAQDDAKIASLNLEDAVKYSTVSIEISQEPFIQYTEIATERTIPEYKASYSTQLRDSFSSGWKSLQDLTIYIARFWSVLLMIGVLFFIFRKWKGNFLALAKSFSKG